MSDAEDWYLKRKTPAEVYESGNRALTEEEKAVIAEMNWELENGR